MDSLEILGTDTTPSVTCNIGGQIEISGRSIPENATEFYSPVLDWIKGYVAQKQNDLDITVFLDYINSISFKMIFEAFVIAEELTKKGKEVKVLWQFDEGDEEIFEEGRVFQSKLKLKFSFEAIPEE